MYAAISADVVSSTARSQYFMIKFSNRIGECLNEINDKYKGFWGRIIRGDSIECILDNPADAFEIAIMLKAWTKAFDFEEDYVQKEWKDTNPDEVPLPTSKTKFFSKFGLRVAIGIDEMIYVNREQNFMDGEAIYRSGRALGKLNGHDKYAFTISMDNEDVLQPLQVVMALVNQIINKATPRKCEILYYRLLSKSTSATADKMNITVSGVNQTLNDLGWSAIEGAIQYYRKVTSKL